MGAEDADTVTCTVSVCELRSFRPEMLHDLRPAEQARAARYLREDDRRRFALGRHAALHLAAAVAGVDAADVSIALHCVQCGASDHGKPRAVCSAGSVPVSISHSGQKVLVAATDGPEIGADIEQSDAARFDPALFGQIASAAEAARLPADAPTFFRLWTLKEAALKCTGDGLMLSPRGFTVDLSADPPRVSGGTGRLAGPMALRLLEAGPGYAAALAVGTRAAVRVVRLG